MRYFTSDLHLCHKRVAELRGYPFVYQHDRAMLRSITQRVTMADTLYVLGDISDGKTEHVIAACEKLDTLQVPYQRRHLILGNHEHKLSIAARQAISRTFAFVSEIEHVHLSTDDMSLDVFCSHYPYRNSLPASDTETIARTPNAFDIPEPYSLPLLPYPLLHGHTHARSYRDTDAIQAIHIGWDAWHAPVSERQIIEAVQTCIAQHR